MCSINNSDTTEQTKRCYVEDNLCMAHHTHDWACGSILMTTDKRMTDVGLCRMFEMLVENKNLPQDLAEPLISHDSWLKSYIQFISRSQMLCFLDLSFSNILKSTPSSVPPLGGNRFSEFLVTWVSLEWRTFLLPYHHDMVAHQLGETTFEDPATTYGVSIDTAFREAFFKWLDERVRVVAPQLIDDCHAAIADEYRKDQLWALFMKGAISHQTLIASDSSLPQTLPPPIQPYLNRSPVPTLAVLCIRSIEQFQLKADIPMVGKRGWDSLLDFNPLEIARQITLQCIYHARNLFSVWSENFLKDRSRFLMAKSFWFPVSLSMLFSWQVLLINDDQWQRETIRSLVKILTHLRRLNNFDGISVVSRCFSYNFFSRLLKSKSILSSAATHILEDTMEFVHFSIRLRQAHHDETLPFLPLTSLILTDLDFLTQGGRFFRSVDAAALQDCCIHTRKPDATKMLNYHLLAIFHQTIDLHQRAVDRFMKAYPIYQSFSPLQEFLAQQSPLSEEELYQRAMTYFPRVRFNHTAHRIDPSTEYGDLEQIAGYPFYDLDILGVNIIFTQEHDLVPAAGTLAKLVERLTSPKRVEPSYLKAFFYTWSSFCKVEDLIQLLCFRFDVPFPTSANQALQSRYKVMVASPTQLRVINALKCWVDRSPHDFIYLPELIPATLSLLVHISNINPIFAPASQRIINSLKRLANEQQSTGYNSISTDPATELEESFAINSGDDYPFNTSPRSVARELASHNQRMFMELCQPIILNEFIYDHSRHPGIVHLVTWSDNLSQWVSSILAGIATDRRLSRLDFLKALLLEAKIIRDYQTFVGLYQGLNNLKLLFGAPSQISSEDQILFTALQGFDSQKQLIQNEGFSLPVIPYIPPFIREIEQAGQIPKSVCNGLINFNRAKLISEIISDLKLYQTSLYPFICSEKLTAWTSDFIFSATNEENLQFHAEEM